MLSRRSAISAANRIGVGTALIPVWNGAPALFRGRRMSAAISTQGLFRNSQAVFKALTGSRSVGFGRTAALRRQQVISFSLIGRATAKPTTWELLSVWRTALFTPLRAIPATPASKTVIRLEAALFMVTAHLPTKKEQKNTRGFYSSGSFALHIALAVPSMIVNSLSPNVSRIESICRRKVVFSARLSANMY